MPSFSQVERIPFMLTEQADGEAAAAQLQRFTESIGCDERWVD